MIQKRGFSRSLATKAGAALDAAVIRALGFAVGRSGPTRAPKDAKETLEWLADHYGRPEFLPRPGLFFQRPEVPNAFCVRRQDLSDGGSVTDIRFRSGYEPFWQDYRDSYRAYEENQIVCARWYRGHKAPRPTGIFLHGMGGGPYFLEEKIFSVRSFLAAGLDVVLFQLPFHGDRRPHDAPRMGVMFPSPYVPRTNEGFGQAIHDLRALLYWLYDHDVPQVGVFGMSLGAYTGALLATVETQLSFVVPMIPAVSLAGLMWHHGRRHKVRRYAERAGVTEDLLARALSVHSPLSRPPRVDKDRCLIIAGEGDRVCPPEHAKTLWEHWGRPRLHWFAGGHVAQFGRHRAFSALTDWLAQIGVLTPVGARP